MNVRWLQGLGVVFVLAMLAVLLRGAVTPSVAQAGNASSRTGATMVEDNGIVYVLANGQLSAYTLQFEVDKTKNPPAITSKRKLVQLDAVRIP